MPLTAKPDRLNEVRTGVIELFWLYLTLIQIVVKSTLLSIGTLGKVTSIISVVSAAFAQRRISHRSVQSNTWMTIGFENCSAVGTSNCLATDGLMACGAILHG
jgi:hypothetical protein